MEIGETLYVHRRSAWRSWLKKHYRTRPDIWLILPRVASGRQCLGYNDAVEEALCFGWIDSIVKPFDEDSRVQRYSPRRRGSSYSQPNKERLARMRAQGRVMPDVEEALPADADPESFRIPPAILRALRADPDAWRHWRSFSPAYQRIRAAYVGTRADDPEGYAKRLDNLVRKTAQGKRFGVNIESYY